MKKSVLAAAVAAVAGNALAVDVYNQDGATLNIFGEVKSTYSNTEKDDKGTKFSMSGSKLGAYAKYDLDNGFYVKGYLRFSFDLNESGNVELSKGFIEAGSDETGSLTLGRHGSVHGDIFDYDQSWAFGGDAKNGENIFGTGSIESGLVYKWSNNGFTFMAQHSTDEEDTYSLQTETKHGEATNNDQRYKGNLDKTMAFGGVWDSDFGLSLKAAYTTATLNKLEKKEWKSGKWVWEKFADSKDVKAVSTGVQAGYSFGDVSLAAAFFRFNYQADRKQDLDVDHNSFGLSAKYKLDDKLNLYTVYDSIEIKSKYPNVKNASDNLVKGEAETKTFTLGLDYSPHKQVVTFVEFAQVDTDFKDKYKYRNSDGIELVAKSSKASKYAFGARVYF
ncbi:porin [Sansalvadorimonas sp. 2012CJ34-2]|uniref:Porin n=1 Tax=Parendozoicomonas callyspongiae TaxID=2942213 RepID=A0ABT0PGT2_9GAMM|nr:porin [Sansalvadorimonas sp. 2012CJ34-2]MCL6270451.1 porin [Sansalvadorimonas sp. 2012CJ34-2]